MTSNKFTDLILFRYRINKNFQLLATHFQISRSLSPSLRYFCPATGFTSTSNAVRIRETTHSLYYLDNVLYSFDRVELNVNR